MKLLGYNNYIPPEEHVCPRGYRVLNKIPRLPITILENLVAQFKILPNILKATVDELDDVEGIGEIERGK